MHRTFALASSLASPSRARGRLAGALALGLVGALVALSACSSDEPTGETTGDGGGGGSSGASGASGGGSTGDGAAPGASSSSSGSSSGAAGPVQPGCVRLQHAGVDFGYRERAFVQFYAPCETAASKAAAATEAGAQAQGSCWFRPLVVEDNTSTSPSAGTITMTGPDPEVEPYEIEFGGSTDLYFPRQMSPLSEGEVETEIAVTAAGAEVPAFSGTLRLAGRTSLTLPASDGVGPFPMRRSADTVLTWPPTRAGRRVVFRVSQSVDRDDTSDRRLLTCDFDGALGTGTVPKELLTLLEPSEMASGRLDLYVQDHTLVEAGRFAVTLEGAQYLLGVDTLPFDGASLDLTD